LRILNKADISIEWLSAEKAKFLVLRGYIKASYEFEKSDKDDSKEILVGIRATFKYADDLVSGVEDRNYSEDEAEPILMECEDY
jgi:hypothetical protein